ncbi:hypothetical protein Q75_05585 [Bacillus coahuilensis p1.1.43]|uniref:Enoyl-CoA hydratase n=1 Tax=Bacillus coahuilensis p1.1.43 TaxID=1150625 RepID=A0A147K9V6_9BACI|nr:enoyl-CoA hydratase/isomerase family protein [Bacillus coahuilensis]KUP07327.1 hypothetical protein Q75_05585 [Bacillus coahuilensis p1.1.43]
MNCYVMREEHGILYFILNQPKKRNAINSDMMTGLEIFLEKGLEQHIKGLCISGEGDVFCSGGDLAEFHKLKTKEEAFPMLSRMGKILYTLATYPKPTFSYLNGTAVGGGAELAISTDFRIMKRNAKLGFIQGTLAITTGWGGGSILMNKIDQGNAFKLLTSAIKYDTDHLIQMGVIQEIVDSQSEAIQHVERHTALFPNVLMAYKSILLNTLHSKSLELAIADEINNCSTLWGEEEHHNKVRLFFTKK